MVSASTKLSAMVGLALAAVSGMRPALAAGTAPPPRPKLPAITSISVQPASLVLSNIRDVRTFIVTGQTKAGYAVDLSYLAHAVCHSPCVRIDAQDFVHPVRAGRATIIVTAGGRRAVLPVLVKSVSSPPVSFVEEIEPVISKIGCNAGTCHGAAKGKDGFKLSLRGYDPAYDYQALIDDVSGRRFNRTDPAKSLMLLKPTEAVPHMGGLVLKPGSRYYKLIKDWIAQGVTFDGKTASRPVSVSVLPKVPNVTLPGMTQKTIVIATYKDGVTKDVTRDAVLSSSQPLVATVQPNGTVTAVRRGEAALLVRYEGNYATQNILVLGDRAGYKWASAPEYNYIDKLVDAKLQKIKALAAPVCGDATYLRRVTLDLTGLPPTPSEVVKFLADKAPTQQKRAALVDSLIGSPDFVEHWTNKWADLLDCSSRYLGDDGVRKFHNWIHYAMATNMPYNQFVKSMLTASGDAYTVAPANYLRIVRDTSTATEDVTQLFLGVRFSCCKCHDHPFERWTQDQYYQIGAYFSQVAFKPGSRPGDEVVYDSGKGQMISPRTGDAVAPDVPVGYAKPITASYDDRREVLADWLTSAKNPFFAQAMANRVWSYFLGKGIIDPVDDIRSSNPPSNPALLAALTKDFVAHGFDVRHIMREIVLSRTYQSTIRTNKWNSDDDTNFSHFIPNRLQAEELLDAIDLATGAQTHFTAEPVGMLAEDLPDSSAPGSGGFLDVFGRPSRQTPCECERTVNVSLGQAMNLINGPTLSDAVDSPTGRIAALMKTNPSDADLVNSIFLASLSRYPTATEMAASTRALHQASTRERGAQDLMWALLNSPAFLFNR
ncbi:MAG: DUF1553 domain-containing protein [Armatimonadetes bacterium]|nr:DUF1553 domain-containing protein [Armatimonadota bacterium]MDE2205951.1 DUF1553 domain-containing protein [Armatimonadota bacterium]